MQDRSGGILIPAKSGRVEPVAKDDPAPSGFDETNWTADKPLEPALDPAEERKLAVRRAASARMTKYHEERRRLREGVGR